MRRRGVGVLDGIRWLLANEGDLFGEDGLAPASPPTGACEPEDGDVAVTGMCA